MKHWKALIILAVIIPMSMGCTAAIRGFPDEPRTSAAAPPDPDYLLGKKAVESYNQETDLLKKRAYEMRSLMQE